MLESEGSATQTDLSSKPNCPARGGQTFSTKRVPPYTIVEFYLIVDFYVCNRSEQDYVLFLLSDSYHTVKWFDVGRLPSVVNSSSRRVCLRVTLTGEALSVDAKFTFCSLEEKHVARLAMKLLHHVSCLFSFNDSTVIVTNYIPFNKGPCRNHTYDKENITTVRVRVVLY